MASQPAAGWHRLPLVIPVVVYNGVEPWRVPRDLGSLIGELDASAEIYRPQLRYLLVDESAFSREDLAALDSPVADLFRIDQSRNWQEVRSGFRRLGQTIPPSESSLQKAFTVWMQKVILPRFGQSEDEAYEAVDLKEMDIMLAESIERWNRELLEEGRQEGRQEARQEGEVRMLLRQLHLKFGPPPPEVEERVRTADADRLLEWGDRVLTAERLEDVFRD